jgi:hypothetical protein
MVNMNNTSYKTEVFVDKSWSSNGLRFATEAEAVEYGKELLSRWFAPTDLRAVVSEDKVNYRFNFDSYKAEPIVA